MIPTIIAQLWSPTCGWAFRSGPIRAQTSGWKADILGRRLCRAAAAEPCRLTGGAVRGRQRAKSRFHTAPGRRPRRTLGPVTLGSLTHEVVVYSAQFFAGGGKRKACRFRACFRKSAVRPFGLHVWKLSVALRRLPMEEPLAARCALQPSAQPPHTSQVQSPTGC